MKTVGIWTNLTVNRLLQKQKGKLKQQTNFRLVTAANINTTGPLLKTEDLIMHQQEAILMISLFLETLGINFPKTQFYLYIVDRINIKQLEEIILIN